VCFFACLVVWCFQYLRFCFSCLRLHFLLLLFIFLSSSSSSCVLPLLLLLLLLRSSSPPPPPLAFTSSSLLSVICVDDNTCSTAVALAYRKGTRSQQEQEQQTIVGQTTKRAEPPVRSSSHAHTLHINKSPLSLSPCVPRLCSPLRPTLGPTSRVLVAAIRHRVSVVLLPCCGRAWRTTVGVLTFLWEHC
jgi:hypothetical protein